MEFFKENFDLWKASPFVDKSLKDELLALDEKEAREVFSSHLQFGTSGLRGVMGVGSNRMNVHVVDRVTRGLSKYILDRFSELNKRKTPRVFIAYDSRHNSRIFAERAAERLSDAGIEVFLFSDLIAVSILSFAIRSLQGDYGIMITASHNSKEYNGYKVYGQKGGQILPDEAEKIQEFIDKEPFFPDRPARSKASLKNLGRSGVHEIYDQVLEAYLAETLKYRTKEKMDGLKVLYSPLNGTGLVPVRKLLLDLGLGSFKVVPDQELPDGDFPGCSQPNPEKEEVYGPGLDLLEEEGADILMVTDPDCDRIGLAIRNKIFSGNEIAMLLFDYLCKRADIGEDVFAARSLVSSPMLDSIAEKYGIPVRETLIGFKYIADLMDREEKKFFFGFEEGNGYLAVRHVRDKDGISTAMLLAEMAAYYKEAGQTLDQVLKSLYKEHGYFATAVASFHFDGLAGQARREKIMAKLRQRVGLKACQEKWFGQEATAIIDYDRQERFSPEGVEAYEDLDQADILKIQYSQGRSIIIRPSGTEPKLKVYLLSKARYRWKAEADLDRMDREVSDFIYKIQSEMMGGGL